MLTTRLRQQPRHAIRTEKPLAKSGTRCATHLCSTTYPLATSTSTNSCPSWSIRRRLTEVIQYPIHTTRSSISSLAALEPTQRAILTTKRAFHSIKSTRSRPWLEISTWETRSLRFASESEMHSCETPHGIATSRETTVGT